MGPPRFTNVGGPGTEEALTPTPSAGNQSARRARCGVLGAARGFLAPCLRVSALSPGRTAPTTAPLGSVLLPVFIRWRLSQGACDLCLGCPEVRPGTPWLRARVVEGTGAPWRLPCRVLVPSTRLHPRPHHLPKARTLYPAGLRLPQVSSGHSVQTCAGGQRLHSARPGRGCRPPADPGPGTPLGFQMPTSLLSEPRVTVAHAEGARTPPRSTFPACGDILTDTSVLVLSSLDQSQEVHGPHPAPGGGEAGQDAGPRAGPQFP